MKAKFRGNYGEKLACAYLKTKGYEILSRNFKVAGGELDIVAQAPNNQLVFIEVKMRTSTTFGHGEESIGTMKLRRIMRAIERYLKEHSKESDPDYRIDIVEIEMLRDKNGAQNQSPIITHFEDIEL